MESLRDLVKSDNKTIKICLSILNKDKQNVNLLKFMTVSELNIQEFLTNQTAYRMEMIEPLLETRKLSSLDKGIVRCLTKILPTRIESVYMIEYLINRLAPTAKQTFDVMAQEIQTKWKDIESIKTMQDLAKTPNLTEKYIEDALVFNATRKFQLGIEAMINNHMENFMEEQRGNWLHRLTEIQDENKRFKKLLRQDLISIKVGRNMKTFCKILLEKWWNMNGLLTKMLKFCFTSRNRHMKMIANMCKNKWRNIFKVVDLKLKEVTSIEEEEIDSEQARKDKSIWYPEIWEKIQANKEWKQAFEKIPFETQPKIMKKFVEDMPILQYYKEYTDYIEKKMKKVYKENIKMLASTTESKELIEDETQYEEIEDIDPQKADELLGKLDLEKTSEE